MNKAVIYVRVRDNQNLQVSIKNQLDTCFNFANEKDFNIVGTFVDIEELGKPTNRVALKEMFEDSLTADWNAIITFNTDRISRNIETIKSYRKKLEKCGKSLLSATASNDETLLNIIKWNDEYLQRRKVK